ncbi:MAG: hypothetical protein WBH56_02120 [Bacteroidota bacterium]
MGRNPIEKGMRRLINYTLLILLVSFAGSVGMGSSLLETLPRHEPAGKAEYRENLGASREATRRSYTQGRSMRLVKKLSPSPLFPLRQRTHCRLSPFIVVHSVVRDPFYSSHYYSTLCNKAPPSV